MRFPTYVLLVLLGSYLFTNCVAKKQWQGKYTTVSYTKIEPKEDFKVSAPDYEIVKNDVINVLSGE